MTLTTLDETRNAIVTVAAEEGAFTKEGELTEAIKKLVKVGRNLALKEAPSKLTCPKCKASKGKSAFGVRTTKNGVGIPMYFAMQSFCRICRRKPKKNAEAKQETAKKASKKKAAVH